MKVGNLGQSLLRCVALGLGVVGLAVGLNRGLHVGLDWSWTCVRDVLVAGVALVVGLVLYDYSMKKGRVRRRRGKVRVTKATVRKALVNVVALVVGGVAVV